MPPPAAGGWRGGPAAAGLISRRVFLTANYCFSRAWIIFSSIRVCFNQPTPAFCADRHWGYINFEIQ